MKIVQIMMCLQFRGKSIRNKKGLTQTYSSYGLPSNELLKNDSNHSEDVFVFVTFPGVPTEPYGEDLQPSSLFIDNLVQ